MRKIIALLLCTYASFANAQTLEDLKGVTFGIGLGYSHLSQAPKDYFLTTDSSHKLQIQNLNKSSIVISSMITIKLGKMAIQRQTVKGMPSKKILVSTKSFEKNEDLEVRSNGGRLIPIADNEDKVTYKKAKFKDKLSINVSLNLAEINNNNISFNKAIDGGIGVGYFANEYTQVALFYDMIRVRQLRDYIVDTYTNKGIPTGSGNEVFNALDDGNKNLFYSKYYSGFSVKVIFSFGNK